MRRTRYNAYAATCPTRQALDRIADKWTVLVIGLLEQRPHRFGELLKAIEGISQKMLTQTLRELERNGLVSRIDYGEIPPRVEYALTDLGRSLADAVRKLDSWAEAHIPQVMAARAEFSRKEHPDPRPAQG